MYQTSNRMALSEWKTSSVMTQRIVRKYLGLGTAQLHGFSYKKNYSGQTIYSIRISNLTDLSLTGSATHVVELVGDLGKSHAHWQRSDTDIPKSARGVWVDWLQASILKSGEGGLGFDFDLVVHEGGVRDKVSLLKQNRLNEWRE